MALPLSMFTLSLVPQVFGRTRINFYIAISQVGSHIILSYVLLRTVGFYGPAISATVSGYISVCIFSWVGIRLTGSSLRKFLPLASMAKVSGCCLVALLGSSFVEGRLASSIGNLVLTGCVFSLIYLGGGMMVGVFTEQDRLLIRRWIFRAYRLIPGLQM